MASRRLRLDRTLGPLVVKWIERELVHGPGDVQGQRIELDDELARFIFDAYRIDDDGRRLIRRAVFSRSKGRAKSEFGAMLACVEALGPCRFAGWDSQGRPEGRPVQSPFIPIFATESDQAGDLYGAVWFMLREGAISRTPGLDVGITRTYLPNGGKITGETSKATSKDGGKETFAVFDETHLFSTDQLIRLHATVRRNLAKRRIAEPWALETTTMYAPGENSVAEASHLYYAKIKRGEVRDPGFLFDHRSGPARFDFDSDEQLRAALIEAYGEAAAWVDVDRIVAEARDPQTEPSDVMRYFVNLPAKREQNLFIKPAVWDALADAEYAPAEGALVALGMDGSRVWDCTAVAWATPLEDGRIGVDCHIFSTRDNVGHHTWYDGGKIDFDDVETFVAERFNEYRVCEVAYDPKYLDRSVDLIDTSLPEASIFPVEPQTKLMRQALATLERLVLEGRLVHSGDDQVAMHLGNCAMERGDVADEVRRVRKIDPKKPIDAVVAMALAVWRAEEGDLVASAPMVGFA